MKNFKKHYLLFVFLGIIMILSGCSGGNSDIAPDTIYKFAGSMDEGDFVDVDINLTDNTYSYEVQEGGDESGSGSFRLIGSGNCGPYEITSGNLSDERFIMLNDEVLLVSDQQGDDGKKLITALKKASGPYGSKIDGEYFVATSLEGVVDTVTVNTANQTVTFGSKLTDTEEDTFSYSFDNSKKAIKIDELNFRHYGVFLDNSIGVFDSYVKEQSEWLGDGMAILVKKNENSDYQLANYEGVYNYIDVDGKESNTIFELKLNEKEDALKLLVDIDGDGTREEHASLKDENGDGKIEFTADFGEGEFNWNILLLPDKMMVIASDDPDAFGGENGGLGIGVKAN